MTNIDNHSDKIFVRNNLTEFEKLLFAQAEIKDLKKELVNADIENGKLQSGIQELKHYIHTTKEMTDIKSVMDANMQLKKNNDNLTKENRRFRDQVKSYHKL